jgi:hypothetical protein
MKIVMLFGTEFYRELRNKKYPLMHYYARQNP